MERNHIFESNALLRLSQIIGNKKKGIAPLIPISKSTWWEGVKSGKFPKQYKVGVRCSVWKASDIFKLLQEIENEQNNETPC